MLTYRQQFDRLTEAYIRGEVDPYNCKACFVGNMLQSERWDGYRISSIYGGVVSSPFNGYPSPLSKDFIERAGYSLSEIARIEDNFLIIISNCTRAEVKKLLPSEIKLHPNYENALFLAFESTLELLKKIHQDKGEVIDETPVFTKRKIQASCIQ